MSRVKTAEEVRGEFLDAVRGAAAYWAAQHNVSRDSVREVCDGLAFSILNIIDGMSGSFGCAIDLTLAPHPEDKQYHRENDEDWCEEGMVINADCMLHEFYYHKHGE